MAELFPSIPAADGTAAERRDLPMMREVKFDFSTGQTLFERGQPVIVEGAEAVKVWVWHAMQAERYHLEHESWRYGNELYRLRGRNYQQGTIEAEAKRYITEALLACPYITSAAVTDITPEGDVLHFTVRYTDIYGGGYTIHV